METFHKTLGAEGLLKFKMLQPDAANAVTERFYAQHESIYQTFGERGRAACHEDIAFHLEFLHPVLEFGLLAPFVDYLRWLGSVLAMRGIPTEHLATSLDWIADFFTEHAAAEDGLVIAAALHAAKTGFLEADAATLASPQPQEAWAEKDAFEVALLRGNQQMARGIINNLIDGKHSLLDIEQHIIQPALYSIGEKWQKNQISVAQEHMATAIVHLLMTEGLLRSTPQEPINKKVLLACVEKNTHDVGLRMVADAFELAGWDVQYLGANVPTTALIRQVVDWKPNLVGLSVSFPHQLQTVRQVIVHLETKLGIHRPPVIIGGLAINRFSRLFDLVGADAQATDAQSAVISADQLIRG